MLATGGAISTRQALVLFAKNMQSPTELHRLIFFSSAKTSRLLYTEQRLQRRLEGQGCREDITGRSVVKDEIRSESSGAVKYSQRSEP